MPKNYPKAWYERELRKKEEERLLADIVWKHGEVRHPLGCACWDCIEHLHLCALRTWARRRAENASSEIFDAGGEGQQEIDGGSGDSPPWAAGIDAVQDHFPEHQEIGGVVHAIEGGSSKDRAEQ